MQDGLLRWKMKQGIVIQTNDIKKILAEKFGVPEGNVIKSQYSFTVVFDSEVEEDEKLPE